jgi:hypothetical protein
MSRYKPYSPEQAYLLPPNVADELGSDHLCFFVRQVVHRLDLSVFEQSYSAEGEVSVTEVSVTDGTGTLGKQRSRNIGPRFARPELRPIYRKKTRSQGLAFPQSASPVCHRIWSQALFDGQTLGRGRVIGKLPALHSRGELKLLKTPFHGNSASSSGKPVGIMLMKQDRGVFKRC